jgi:hypothetical protein
MTLTEWLEEIEGYGLRVERFIDDCDHHKEGSTGSNERMIQWLRAAYEVGYAHRNQQLMDDLK